MSIACSPLLARIDDRLIHGQVVVGCCEPLGARRILLVNETVAADPLQQKLYRAGVPPEVAVEFLTPAHGSSRLKELSAIGELADVVVVVARAQDMEALCAGGVRFARIQLGGAHMHEGATEFVEGVFLDGEDRVALGNLLDHGTELVIQAVVRSPAIRVDRGWLPGARR